MTSGRWLWGPDSTAQLDSQLEHMPGLHFQSPIRGLHEATMFLSHSPSLPLNFKKFILGMDMVSFKLFFD